MKSLEKLNEKAAAIAGALTGAVLHALGGLFLWGMPGVGMGAMRAMMYYQFPENAFAFSFTSFIGGILGGLIIGAIVGYLIAVFYNWGLKK